MTDDMAEDDKTWVEDDPNDSFLLTAATCDHYVPGEPCDRFAVSVPGHDLPTGLCFYHLKKLQNDELLRRWVDGFVEAAHRNPKFHQKNFRHGVFENAHGNS